MGIKTDEMHSQSFKAHISERGEADVNFNSN